MIETIGLNSTPYSVIFWYKGDVTKNRTICYSQEEEENVIDRLNDEKSFYSGFDRVQIIRRSGIEFNIFKNLNLKEKLACQIG